MTYKKNIREALDFGPGFTCILSDESNKYFIQNIAVKLTH